MRERFIKEQTDPLNSQFEPLHSTVALSLNKKKEKKKKALAVAEAAAVKYLEFQRRGYTKYIIRSSTLNTFSLK